MTDQIAAKVALRKIARLNEQLERRFDLSLDLDSIEHLQEVRRHYEEKRQHLLTRYGISEAMSREDYAKAVMISEAIGLFLREIAPTRTKPRTIRKERK